MDIHKLARKLKPLMPKEVDRWLKARETADPDLRDLIDKQIVSAARRKLGDGNGKVLLSIQDDSRIEALFAFAAQYEWRALGVGAASS